MRSMIVAAGVLLALVAAPAAAQTRVSACGTLVAFEAPTGTRPTGQVQINEAGTLRTFQVTGTGTVSPPDIAAIGTALSPVTARFEGAAGAAGVVTAFSLTRVATCPAATPAPSAPSGQLPSTATAVDGNATASTRVAADEPRIGAPPLAVALVSGGVILLALGLLRRRRI